MYICQKHHFGLPVGRGSGNQPGTATVRLVTGNPGTPPTAVGTGPAQHSMTRCAGPGPVPVERTSFAADSCEACLLGRHDLMNGKLTCCI
jgi:hypothetical protein